MSEMNLTRPNRVRGWTWNIVERRLEHKMPEDLPHYPEDDTRNDHPTEV